MRSDSNKHADGKDTKARCLSIRQAAPLRVPIITTIAGAKAAVQGLLEVRRNRDLSVRSIQEYHAEV